MIRPRLTLALGTVVALVAAMPAAVDAHTYFEFFNFDTNATQASFPLGAKNEIVVRSDETNVSKLLPIAIVIRADDARYKNAIPNNPELACADEFTCSLAGPVIPATTKYLELQAITTSGDVLATYTMGTPPAEPSPTATSAATTMLSPAGEGAPAATTTPALAPTNEPAGEDEDANAMMALLVALVLLLLLGGGVAIFMSASGNESECVDACTLGTCNSCELNDLILATHNQPKGTEKDLTRYAKLLLDALGLAPLPSAGPAGKGLVGGIGGVVSKPPLKENLEAAIDALNKRSGMGTWGVDIWARLEMVKCMHVRCWPQFWRQKTAWVSEFNDFKIEPPDAYKLKGGGPDVGWNFHYLFGPNQKDREAIGQVIRELALKHCGNCPHAKITRPH